MMRGIRNAILLSIPLWALIGYAVARADCGDVIMPPAQGAVVLPPINATVGICATTAGGTPADITVYFR